MKKKFKTKKKFNIKKFFIILMILFIFILFNLISKSIRSSITNEIIVENIFKTNDNYAYKGVENNHITKEIYYYLKEKNHYSNR